MSITKEEAIYHIQQRIPGKGQFFITQPSKSTETQFGKYVKDSIKLIESTDPYAQIIEYATSHKEEIVSLSTNGQTVFKNLPFLSGSNFKSSTIVSHVELSNFDYSIVTSLRDLEITVLVSQTTEEVQVNAALAYNVAQSLGVPVFHFYASSDYDVATTYFKDAKIDQLLTTKEVNSIEELVSLHEVEPFQVINPKTKKSAKDAILYLGQVTPELVDAVSAENTLLITVNVYRPFELPKLLTAIPASVSSLTVVTQSTTPVTSSFSPLLLDFFQNYSNYQSLKNFSKVVSATFGYIKKENWSTTVQNLLANTHSTSPIQNLSIGKVNTELATKISKQQHQDGEDAIAKAFTLEQVYLKLLEQINSNTSSLNILNEFNAETIGDQKTPEYGFGAFLRDQEQRQKLQDLVRESVQENLFKTPKANDLIESLSKWLILSEDGTLSKDVEQSEVLSNDIISILQEETSSRGKQLLELSNYFKFTKNWLVGSDSWAYDLGSSGVHHVLSSGANVNMLIIDSEPYEEKSTGSSLLNGFRKKDVGLYAMNYGGCYVASVAIYSSYTQVLQALIEAEKFNGPSIVLAYLPYHSESDDTLSVLKETKKAVDTGYWPLYRYNSAEEQEDLVFKLDSSNLRNQLKDFLDRQNKLTLLSQKDPLLSRNLLSDANSAIKAKQTQVADEAFSKLLSGLSGPPLTVAFASDGGNAEGVAKKINRQALGRGLKSIVLAMDDLSIEDLPSETNVVFVSSTSGQGEFPTNGKQLWDALKNTPDLDLSGIKFSVFGLGDSEYWPRKEDKHYYNKPAKDLFAKLKFYGGVDFVDIGLGDDQDADGFNTGLNEWIEKLWKALGVDNVEGVEEPKPITNEDMKINSDYLRGTIVEGLNDQSTGAISAVDQQLTKFHGIYMQDDRDIRDERKAQGMEPAYAFMVRARLPGGIATPQQYLKIDQMSDERGNGTLKLTTRATFQLHGVVKHDLKPAIRGMNSVLMDTLAACGDVNRNVMVSALPGNAKVHKQVSDTGALISEFLLPQTTAYHEIWLEGKDDGDEPGYTEAYANRKDGPKKKKTLVAGNALVDVEPQYGSTYLPRKFKIVITVPPYNDVDVYAHDIGLIAIVNENDEVTGYNLVAGGGMGSTHNNKKTYPRTGSMFGYVSKDKVHIACEKIMLVQRDFGDRTNRKHARLKYTIDDLGVDVFKAKVEERLGFKFEEPKEFEIKSNVDYFGWCKDENGLNHFTIFIENGRIENTTELPQKTGLKKIAEYLTDKESGEFRLTGNQHLLISKVQDADLESVKQLLAQYKLDNTDFSGLRLSSAACVAFPTCGLAMAESERYLPELITKLESSLEEYGLRHDSVVMRMTGCPNGCARPWVAEVALVGKALGAYNLMLGGGHHGERLNKIYRYSIKEDEILSILKPLFKSWSLERNEGEPFGDFVIRTGIIKPTLEGKYFHDDIPIEA
ncbi:sulfite reductase [NADPH] subunit beta [[Candida] anglica]|uniref:Sulfite reductase [NADPH] subunit beta n=1 Tax=[Candida] anglica TaxID=148631 RepID=A0ABP0E5J6_9ASCO